MSEPVASSICQGCDAHAASCRKEAWPPSCRADQNVPAVLLLFLWRLRLGRWYASPLPRRSSRARRCATCTGWA